MIITIDGPSGTGKSTIAREVAKCLHFTFFDTGAMYRCFAAFLHKNKVDISDVAQVIEWVKSFSFEIKTSREGEKSYEVQGEDVSDFIRSETISLAASTIAQIPEVRKVLALLQHKFAEKSYVVFEGRDMGTVVFPQADIKIFLTASDKVRAERRYKQLMTKFPGCSDAYSYEQILKDIRERDHRDTHRAISPLKRAPDAVFIDTSKLSIQQIVDRIVGLYKRKLQKKLLKMKWPYWFVYSVVRFFFRVFFRLRIEGLQYFRPGHGILAANHVSLYDPEVVSISCPEEVHFLAKESLFRIPILGKLIRVLNAHSVSRGGGDAATFRKIFKLLSDGKKVILFPEGSRSDDGRLQPLEKGLSFLVQRAKCPIFPVYVEGTFAAWPRGKKFPKFRGRVTCLFGPPILWEEFEGLEKKQAAEKITERTYEALSTLQAKAKKTMRPR